MTHEIEYVDVLDAYMRPTGEVVPKDEAHSRELWHAGAHAWIYRLHNGAAQLLMQHRHPDKEIYPNTWDISAAGHVSAGQTPEQTAIRETKEELGLDIAESELTLIGVTRAVRFIPNKGWTHRVFDYNYLVRQDNLDPATLTLQAEETTAAEWRDINAVEADLRDPELAKMYSLRQSYLYVLAFEEIRREMAILE